MRIVNLYLACDKKMCEIAQFMSVLGYLFVDLFEDPHLRPKECIAGWVSREYLDQFQGDIVERNGEQIPREFSRLRCIVVVDSQDADELVHTVEEVKHKFLPWPMRRSHGFVVLS